MQVFELHFNPGAKKDKIIDSFVYEPENSEKRLGNLYMAGELVNAMPQNSQFLNNLSSLIKKEYYRAGQKTCEASFQETLKKTNEFLDKQARAGNVGWLGNLNFTILAFKDLILSFTKTGDMKILLIRNGEILDLGQNLEFQDTEPYPLKIFENIAAGKLAQNNKIVVLTKDLFSVFEKNKDLLNQFSRLSDKKDLKEILRINREVLSKVSGICLLLIANALTPGKIFSLGRTPSLYHRFKNLNLLKFRNHKLPMENRSQAKRTTVFKRWNLLFALTLVLIVGFLVFGNERKKEIQEIQQKIEEIQSKITMAENFLILKDQEKAKELFEEAGILIIPLVKPGAPLRDKALYLQKSIEKQLQAQ